MSEQRRRILALLEEIRKTASQSKETQSAGIAQTMAKSAELMAELANQADMMTRRIVHLTWALVWLTVVLLLFTGYLTYDIYQQRQRHHLRQEHPTQQDATNRINAAK